MECAGRGNRWPGSPTLEHHCRGIKRCATSYNRHRIDPSLQLNIELLPNHVAEDGRQRRPSDENEAVDLRPVETLAAS